MGHLIDLIVGYNHLRELTLILESEKSEIRKASRSLKIILGTPIPLKPNVYNWYNVI